MLGAHIHVEQLRLDSKGRLRLRPLLPPSSSYSYIWRDATSVRWDDELRELYVHDVPEFTPVREFQQIVAAVAREYGNQLVSTPLTSFVDVPSEIVSALREVAGQARRSS